MDFFEFLFGKKEDKSPNKEQVSSNDKTNEKVNENKLIHPVQPSLQPNTVSTKPANSGINPVEQYVKESVADLKKHTALSTKDLEAEAIYLAAFLYMKGSYQIDFELDYFSEGLLNKIPSGDYAIADKVFSYMIKYGEGYYGLAEQKYGIKGYKMNIQMCSDYGSHIKNYFIRAHKIGSSNDFMHFSSPRNCLWRNGIKAIDSPTQRDIYYRFDDEFFEFMIPPFNPLVTGNVVEKTTDTLRCESYDERRTFIFHYEGEISPDNLKYIEMFRNDKGDMVSYHKEMEKEVELSLEKVLSGGPIILKFKKMMCTIRKQGSSWFGTVIVIEDPLPGNLTAIIDIKKENIKIDLPKTNLINERGGVNVNETIELTGSFVKEDSEYAPICYHMNNNGFDISILQKNNKIFSFVEIPVSPSTQPNYLGSDLISIELDMCVNQSN